MPYMSRWINEPYILCTTFTGNINVDEVDTLMQEYLERLDERSSIYIMVNFARAASIPTTLLQMDSIIDVLNHDNVKWFILINPTGFDSNTTRLLAQDKVKILDTKDNALGFLRGMVRLDTGVILESE